MHEIYGLQNGRGVYLMVNDVAKKKLPKGLLLGEYMMLFPRHRSQYYRFGKYFPDITNLQLTISHEKYYINIGANKVNLCELISVGLFGFMILEALKIISSLFVSVPISMVSYVLIALSYLSYQIIHLVQQKSRNNQLIFCRKTGKIIRRDMGSRGHDYFFEFEGFEGYCFKSPLSQSCYELFLVNPSKNWLMKIADFKSPRKLWVQWDFIQQFMDLTKPLPDTPEFEACREFDKTTKIFDKEWKRTPYFWRSMPEKQVMKYSKEAFWRIRTYQGDLSEYPFEFLAENRLVASDTLSGTK